ncbi:MAG: FkbM family methyltransferase [Deltaproteobacteria bacterium]|nr:FkbM family methyltransferase [Deltaproteobacteria bacterium]
MSLGKTIRFIWDHPLTQKDRVRALVGFVRWQIGSRLVPGPVVAPFVDDTVLVVAPGMSGATGNVYVGLHEVAEMGFVLHWLRPGDRFADVGANVGSYTVLAAGAAGADVVAFEPVPATHRRLLRNVAINGLEGKVDARLAGVGAAPERLRFTADRDTTNRALADGEAATGATVDVDIVTLDQALADAPPALIKIDVEGFEDRVLAGAAGILADPRVQALVVELAPDRGYNPATLVESLTSFGFQPVRYAAVERRLEPTDPALSRWGNLILVKDLEAARDRVRSAPRHRVLAGTL